MPILRRQLYWRFMGGQCFQPFGIGTRDFLVKSQEPITALAMRVGISSSIVSCPDVIRICSSVLGCFGK